LGDLGIPIPIVLVAAPGEASPVSSGEMLRIVDADSAATTVAELARMIHPLQVTGTSGTEHRTSGFLHVSVAEKVASMRSMPVRFPPVRASG